MVLAIGVTFQIIEALLKAIDSMKKKKCMIIDQKQITVAENKLLVLKKYVPRNNSPDVLADSQKYYQSNSIVQQYEQEKNYAYMIVIAKKTEKQILVICFIEQHKDNNDRSGKKSP